MVYLVSDNIISSLGFNSAQNAEAIKQGIIGIKSIHDLEIYPESFMASMVDSELMGESFQKLNTKEGFTHLEKMMILSAKDALSQTDIDITSKKTGIIISTTKGNIDLLESGKKDAFNQERVLLWKLAEVIARYFQNPNQPLVISNACISGVVAINTAALLINSGRYNDVLVIGGDLVSKFVVSGFMSFLSLSAKPCKPFDKKRDGLSLGEAAGTIILSKEKSGNNDIAWLGGASANDANHISGPSRTAEGSFIALEKAMNEAGVQSKYIDHISAHGTATPYNDEMESISINRHGLEGVPLNSMKGYLGHTLGAAGVVEAAVLLHEMRTNSLIKSAGYEECGVSQPVNVIQKNQSSDLQTCLKMASGFGGSNAAMIIQKV